MYLYEFLLVVIYLLVWVEVFFVLKLSELVFLYSMCRADINHFKNVVLPVEKFDTIFCINGWATIENKDLFIVWNLRTRTMSSREKKTNDFYCLHGGSYWSFVHKGLTNQLIRKFGRMDCTYGDILDRNALIDNVVLSHERAQETVSQ